MLCAKDLKEFDFRLWSADQRVVCISRINKCPAVEGNGLPNFFFFFQMPAVRGFMLALLNVGWEGRERRWGGYQAVIVIIIIIIELYLLIDLIMDSLLFHKQKKPFDIWLSRPG